MPTSRSTAPRSLAEDLRRRSDAELVALLTVRPDLATPLPSDVTSLAARAATRASSQRALDGLDAYDLGVATALAALPEPTSRAEVARLVPGPAAPVGRALKRLRERALTWGPESATRLVRAARDVLGPHPGGLGPPLREALDRRSPARLARLAGELGLTPHGDAERTLEMVAEHLARPETLDALLAGAPEGARAVLERLAPGPPVGAVAGADREADTTSTSPLGWLLGHGLLAVQDAGHVVLPREVGLYLRGGVVDPSLTAAPPAPRTTEHPVDSVDRHAGGAAVEILRLVAELGVVWGRTPPPVLRNGSLGVRELRRTAQALEVDERRAALVVELAHACGLVADDGEVDPAWAPTPTYDEWLDLDAPHRWGELVAAWAETTRTPGLVGTRDDRDAVRAALGPDLDRPAARSVRRAVLADLADLPAGAAPTGESVVERLRWRAPRRAGSLHDRLVGWTLEEAEVLGVTGRGALSSAGRVLAAGLAAGAGAAGSAVAGASVTALAAAIRPALPAPVDHVLLQADLTAIAPGPLEPHVGRLMDLAADVESRGGATVYRFTADSVRRALDAGHGADALVEALAAASRTPLPQPLDFLVRDVARRHGALRVGPVASYVRSDDEAALRELVADRRTAHLRLRRIAPTVLVSPADTATVLAGLREAGLAPAAESADGDVVVRASAARRTPPRRRPRPVMAEHQGPPPHLLESVVAGLRKAESQHVERPAAGAAAVPSLVPTDPAVTLSLLREAAAGRARVWIGYADAAGTAARRLVEPLTVDGGRVTAFDHGTDEVRTFSIHRVTGVALAEG